MQLRVRSLRSREATVTVSCSIDVEQLKGMLHADGAVDIPPEKQRIMYVGKVLGAGTLEDAGVCDGDSVVVLATRPAPPEADPDAGADKIPDREMIKSMTTAEADARGIMYPAQREGEGATGSATVEAQIQHLLSAVTGIGGEDGGGGGSPMDEEDDDEDLDEPVPSPAVPAGPLAQLMDMGFPEPRVRKALVLNRNSMQMAMEWLLQHSEEASADTPLTRRQVRAATRPSAMLRSVLGERPGVEAIARRIEGAQQREREQRMQAAASPAPRVVEPSPALLQQLVEMGFPEEAAGNALRSAGNDFDRACAILLGEGGGGGGSSGVGGGGGGGPEPAAGAVASGGGRPGGGEGGVGGADGDVDLSGLMGTSGSNPLLQDILRHPSVRQGMQSQRVMEAFQAMVENPLAAHRYLSDPEVGPILLQVHNVLLRGMGPPGGGGGGGGGTQGGGSTEASPEGGDA